MKLDRFKLRFLNYWPPFFFAGIRVTRITQDIRHIQVKLKLRFWNANYVGTQYGGSIFSMTDPFYMLMLINNLGSEYSVWDKSATIRYLKPGRTDLTAEFLLTEEDLDSIRKNVHENGKMYWIRKIEVKDLNGELIADVDKTLSIKKKLF
jgi:acyl-coenzyme A thioesterase PaaI-like protein